jgi:hypothetical protein
LKRKSNTLDVFVVFLNRAISGRDALVCPASFAADYPTLSNPWQQYSTTTRSSYTTRIVSDNSRDPSLLRSICPNRSAVGAPAVPLPCRTVVQRPKGPQLLGGQVAIGSGAPARHPRAGGPPPVRSGDPGRGVPDPLRRRGPDPPLPGGTRRTEWGAPPGGVRAGGAEPHCDPPRGHPPLRGGQKCRFWAAFSTI